MKAKGQIGVLIYLPLHVKKANGSEFVRYTQKAMGYFPVKEGDLVDMRKRGSCDEQYTQKHCYKVQRVQYNAADNACVAILEPKVLADEKAVSRFSI